MIVGTFTDVVEKAKTYYEDHSGHVYFFRIQAGLCRASLRHFKFRAGRAQLSFDGIRGQPDQIRLGFADGSWSEWQPFTAQLSAPAKRKPHQYQLKSRLDVLSAPQTVSK